MVQIGCLVFIWGVQIFVDFVQIVFSCVVLWLAAEYLIQAIVGLSKNWNIGTTFLAITVIAFGTSVPELAACIVSVIEDHPDISVGNVMGSNLFNLLVVAGLSAAISPLKIERYNLATSWCALLLSTLLFYVLSLDGEFSIGEALLMIASVVLATYFIYRDNKYNEDVHHDEISNSSNVKLCTWAVMGIVGIVLGSKFAIDGAVGLGNALGISDRIIGLTIISVGTSVPELVVSMVALKKGHNNIALANVVGSNIINTIGVTGFTALVAAPLKMGGSFLYDFYWVAIITLLATVVTLLSKKKIITRPIGIISLILYAVYMFTLFLF